MKFNVEVELSTQEINFLKKFDDKETINKGFLKILTEALSLEAKGVIKVDYMNNCHT